jgi:transcriptional regulator with XRE-family HTH domain
MSRSAEPIIVKPVYTFIMDKLGARLTAARKAEGLSQMEVAAELGVTKGSLSAWENDKNFPQLDKFAQLCSLYRVSADQLLYGPSSGLMAHVIESGPPDYVSADLRRLSEVIHKITDRQRRGLLDFLDGWV